MQLLVVLALACSCTAQLLLPYSAVVPWATTYTTGQGFGHYAFDQTQHQTRFPDGSVLGSYSYIDADGKPVVTTYKSGAGIGFVVTGSNALPEAVVDTPEVAAAKAEFQAAFDAASAAAAPAAETPAEPAAEDAPARKKRQVFYTIPVAPPAAVEVKAAEPDEAKAEAIHLPLSGLSFPSLYHGAPFTTPYTTLGSPITTLGSATLGSTTVGTHPLVYSHFPYFLNLAKPAEPAAEEARRKRRSVAVPLPYLHAVPAVAKHTFETKQFEPVEAAVPAATTKIELTTKEHEISVPTFKYVQPVVNYKPVTYTAVSHLPYTFPYGHLPLLTVKPE